jgi:hypothetical protein
MVRDIVKDPTTGRPAVAVTNYELLELDELRAAKEAAEQHHAAATILNTAGYVGADTILGEAETRLTDAKSELETSETIAGESGNDSGEEATSGEVADGTPVEDPQFQQVV